MLKRTFFTLFFSILPAFGLPLLATEAPTSSGTICYQITIDRQGQVAELWLPYPSSDSYQTISAVQISGNYDSSRIFNEPQHGNKVLYARWQAGAQKPSIRFSFAVQRSERTLAKAAVELPEPPAKLEQYLSTNSLDPADTQVTELANSIAGELQDPLEKVQAIYDYLVDNMARNPDTVGCGTGDVADLLVKMNGKCVDFHSLFVALVRSAGLPAREVLGIRMGRQDGADLTGAFHCWAEFYLEGSGWQVADPGDVRKLMLKRGISDPHSTAAKALRHYYFGNVDRHRVRLAVGRNLVLSKRHQQVPLNYLMYPYAEVDARPLNYLDQEELHYQISYQSP